MLVLLFTVALLVGANGSQTRVGAERCRKRSCPPLGVCTELDDPVVQLLVRIAGVLHLSVIDLEVGESPGRVAQQCHRTKRGEEVDFDLAQPPDRAVPVEQRVEPARIKSVVWPVARSDRAAGQVKENRADGNILPVDQPGEFVGRGVGKHVVEEWIAVEDGLWKPGCAHRLLEGGQHLQVEEGEWVGGSVRRPRHGRGCCPLLADHAGSPGTHAVPNHADRWRRHRVQRREGAASRQQHRLGNLGVALATQRIGVDSWQELIDQGWPGGSQDPRSEPEPVEARVRVRCRVPVCTKVFDGRGLLLCLFGWLLIAALDQHCQRRRHCLGASGRTGGTTTRASSPPHSQRDTIVGSRIPTKQPGDGCCHLALEEICDNLLHYGLRYGAVINCCLLGHAAELLGASKCANPPHTDGTKEEGLLQVAQCHDLTCDS
eukprot:m.264651 g.264651  ORF g.264651 m.264651 type:complete len:432 (+) comp26728_c0_seq4:1546-2841(+)